MTTLFSLEPRRLLTSADMRTFLQCSDQSLRARIRRGQIPPPFKVGGSLAWDSSTIIDWLDEKGNNKTVGDKPASPCGRTQGDALVVDRDASNGQSIDDVDGYGEWVFGSLKGCWGADHVLGCHLADIGWESAEERAESDAENYNTWCRTHSAYCWRNPHCQDDWA